MLCFLCLIWTSNFHPPNIAFTPRNVGSPEVCGVCRPEDAQCAIAAGANLIGVIFAKSQTSSQQANRWNKGQTDEQNPSGWGMFLECFFLRKVMWNMNFAPVFFCPLCSLNMIILMMANVFFSWDSRCLLFTGDWVIPDVARIKPGKWMYDKV